MPDDASVASLVARAGRGDAAAWTEIVERYSPLLWAICRRYRLHDAEAQDVAGTVWLRLVERLDRLREPAALPGWLATTTRNECLTVLRKAGRQVPTEDDDLVVDADPGTEHWLLEQERYVALRQAFAQLSDRCRRLLRLTFADPPIAYADIAAQLGVPLGSVGPTRGRCLDSLRRHPAVALLVAETRTLTGGEA